MIKIAFLCVIIAINYIQCNSVNITYENDTSIVVPIKDVEQMKFLTSLNFSEIQSNQSNNNITVEQPSDTSVYYKWLNFFKTSTSTEINNFTIRTQMQ